jgi:RNA polymerase sigma-70 factor (ECF subfamily)
LVPKGKTAPHFPEQAMRRTTDQKEDPQGAPASVSTPADWVDRHGDVLYRMALLRVGNAQVAEDLVQDTFLAALKTPASFEGRSSERTWLAAILKRKIIDHYRQSWRMVDFPDAGNADLVPDFFTEGERKGSWKPESAPSDWGRDPEVSLENKELRSVLVCCINNLPARMAAVFALREMDGWSTDDICKEFSITPSNLWVVLHRARAQLRRCLDVNWFASARQKG